MTTRKADIALTSRLTAYVTRQQGAAELQVSPSTWDDMVASGQIPPPLRFGRLRNILRWRWADVDMALAGQGHDDERRQEPFFRGLAGGKTKDCKREIA